MADRILSNYKIFKDIIKDFFNDTNENVIVNYYIFYLIYYLSYQTNEEKNKDSKDNKILLFLQFLDKHGFSESTQIEAVMNYCSSNEILNKSIDMLKVLPGGLGWFIGTAYTNLQSLIFKKAGGSFYTPEEVIKYLISRVVSPAEIIKNPFIKILDPACGSGFFLYTAYDYLIQIYQENIHQINDTYPELKLSKDNIGLHIIENNLNGIDIDPMGVLISRIGLLDKGGYLTSDKKVKGLNVICADSLFHFQDEGYDLVIGNPPWISFGLRDLGKINKEQREKLTKILPFSSQYKISYYSLFIEKGINFLKKGGKLAFITPDSYLLGSYFTNLRKYMLSQGTIREITLLGKSIFKGVKAGYEALLIYEKKIQGNGKNSEKNVKDMVFAQWAKDIQSLTEKRTKWYIYSSILFYENSKTRFYLCFDKESYEIINLFKGRTNKFQDYFGFYSGCIGRYGQKSMISDGKPINHVIKDKKGQVIWNDNTAEANWYPLIESGSKIKPFYISPTKANIYLHPEARIRKIYGKSGFKIKIYKEPKILLRQTGDKLIAAYDEGGLFTLNNIHLIYSLAGDSDDLLYALCLLNSNLYNYYYQVISMEKGRMLAQIDLDVIKELPLVFGNMQQKKELVELVKILIKMYKKNNYVDLSLENSSIGNYISKINNIVYDIANVNEKLRGHIEEIMK